MKKFFWTSLEGIFIKEVQRFMRIWVQTLVPPVITITMYFLVFGKFIGDKIGIIDNYSYIEYITPGLIMMAVIINSYSNVVSSFFSAKFHKNIEEILVSPISYHSVIIGYVLGGMARGCLVGILVTLIAWIFTSIDIHSILISLITMIVISCVASLSAMINGIFAKKFDDLSLFQNFILTPMIYLGGVFIPLSFFNEFWKNLILINPITYMVNLFRYGFIGLSEVSILAVVCMLTILIFLLYSLVYYLLIKGIGLKK